MSAFSQQEELCASTLQWRQERNWRLRLEGKLALLEEFNELLVESSGDCIVVLDPAGCVLSINKIGREMLRIENEKSVLCRPWEVLFPALEPKTTAVLAEIPRHGMTFQASSKTETGEARYWKMLCRAFGSALPPDRYVLIARDVTEQVLAEKALRQSEAAFRRVFEENPIGMALSDLGYRISRVNNALSAMLGFSHQELLGRDLRALRCSEESEFGGEFARLIQGEIGSFQNEALFQTKRNLPVWGHTTTSVLRDSENMPVAILQMIENIQDRKTTEEQVLAYQEQLQSLASELALSEERERRRIATNLHDRIGQTLAFARLKLARIGRDTEGIAEIRDLIEAAIIDTRSLTFELSPPVLYELGLVAAVEWLARNFQEEHRIHTRFHDDGLPKPLDDDFRVVLFQSVRELLINIVKHARASNAQILLRRDADALRLIIEDDGTGFDISRISAKREGARSFGLFNVRERVEYLGGQVKIRSEPGRGTRVTLIAPLKLDPQRP